jgi:CRISPR system Cascade subunit CasE
VVFLTKVDRVLSHRDVMSGFPKSDSLSPRAAWNVLYRVESARSTLIQSSIAPTYCWPQLQQQFDLELELDAVYRFRLALNSVQRERINLRHREHKICPIEWLKARNFGAELDIKDIQYSPVSESSARSPILVHRHFIEGLLKVDDAEKLTAAIVQGIGRGRAYGCGLLSIKRSALSIVFGAETP